MKSWKSFGIGVIVGSVLTAAVFVGISCRWPNGFRSGPNEKHFLNMLTRKLDLTADQQQTIGNIIDKRREQMKLLRGEVRPKFEELRRATSEEIRAVLTEEQKEKFQRIEERMKKRIDRYRSQMSAH